MLSSHSLGVLSKKNEKLSVAVQLVRGRQFRISGQVLLMSDNCPGEALPVIGVAGT